MARRYSARVDLAPALVVQADLVVHRALVVRADLAPGHLPVVLVPARRVQAAPLAVPAQAARVGRTAPFALLDFQLDSLTSHDGGEV